jgi:choline dehydrogenase
MTPQAAPAPQFDYIVVGAGTAGCVLADRLSANGRHSVLLLEAGPRDNYIWIHVPIGYGKTMFHPVYNWGFYTEPEPTMNGRRIYWPRGKGFGGCSSINGLIYVRGQPEDYDAWAAAGSAGWSWRDVLPYFRKLESNSRGESEWHGASGPLACTDIATKHELIEAIIAGAGELGIPRNDDFNGPAQEGVGYYQLNTKGGWRSSTATGYLRPAMKRSNLHVETNAQATGITFDGTRATGVSYHQGGETKQAGARREVLLAAGALQSPQLLMLSGVGPASHLQEHGIAVRVDSPGVGENLQDHLQLRLIYECTKPITTNDDLNSLWRSAKIGMQWILFRSGPLAIGINQGGLFTRALPESKTPDVQFHFATLSADMAGAKVHPFSGFTFSVCQLRPTSRGRVRLKSADPLAAPAMHANYLATEEDRRCALAGVKLARRIASTSSVRALVKREYRPGDEAKSDDELLDFCRQWGATIFHPVGTTKMGDDPMAVVDASLRVRGVTGVRVVDASIMPTICSGNTAAPVVMIAEKASDLILADAA